jgi:hypothetical protein
MRLADRHSRLVVPGAPAPRGYQGRCPALPALAPDYPVTRARVHALAIRAYQNEVLEVLAVEATA